MRRHRWLLLGLYVPLILLLFGTLVVASRPDAESMYWWGGLGVFLVFSQIIFICVPGRPEYLTPVRARHLVAPAIVAGLMMAALIGGLTCALWELLLGSDVPDFVVWVFWSGLVPLWVIWTVVFYVQCRCLNRFQAIRRMVMWLLKGSLLQLLATVPSHVVVSRRPGCMVGFFTACGMMAGIYVMLWAFGPGIALLFWAETRRQMAGHCPACGYNLRGLPKRRCPECGRPFTLEEIGKSPEDEDFAGIEVATLGMTNSAYGGTHKKVSEVVAVVVTFTALACTFLLLILGGTCQ